MKEQYILKQIKKTNKVENTVETKRTEKQDVKLERGTIVKRLKSDRHCLFLEYDKNAGFLLFFLFPKITVDIIKRFQQMQKIEIAFSKINEIGFLCFKMGDLNWIECPLPYCFFVQEQNEVQKDINVSFVIVKSDIGFIEEIYSVSLEKEFQSKLKKELSTFEKILTLEEYEKEIDKIYLRHDTPEKIMKMASCHTTITFLSSL